MRTRLSPFRFVPLLLVVALLIGPHARAEARPEAPIRPARDATGESRPSSFAPASPTSDPDSLLVHLRRGASSERARSVAADAGVSSRRYISSVGVAVVSTEGRRSSDVAAELRADPRVERVEPNRMRYATGDPNDPGFFDQTHLFNSRLPAAWDVTHGSPTTDIAILDSGVDLNHPDLASRIVPGRDIVNNDSSAQDDHGHGTAVAGIAAADSDNNIGIAGTAWDARIMPVKVLGADGGGTDADIAAGIEWAVDAGAEIINLSLGGPGSSVTLANAVNYATANGVLMIAASGNESTDLPSYPAAYDAVVAVGATDWYGDVAAFSNRGPHVDVVAQGVGVVTTAWETVPGALDDYTEIAGTSAAAPIVSGVAALVKAKNPSFTPAQIASRLRSTAIDRGPSGTDDHYGNGLLDAYAAVGGMTAGSPPQAVRDNAEPNDTAASAAAIAAEQTATLAPEGDIDWFYVDAPQAGTITVNVAPPVADDGNGVLTFDPVISAWSPTFGSMGSFDSAGPGANEVATVQVGIDGRYRFRVTNFASSRSTGTLAAPDAYSISAVFAPAAVVATPGDALWVTDVSPAPFSRDVAASVSPTVTFARDLTEQSAEHPASVRLVDGKTGAAVATTNTYDAGTKTVSMDPTPSLVAGRTYVVKVDSVQDLSSDVMDDTYTSRFTVTPPTSPDELVADFNGDGFEDVAIGVPGEDLFGKVDGGVVHVMYGSASGPSGAGSQMWHQNVGGIAGGVEAGDRFGEALATGDLNKDGFDDLVIGVPYEDLKAGQKNAGAFHVIFGSANKLRSTGSQLWTQDSPGIPGVSEANDLFGSSFAIGTFDGSSGNDLAVGAPGEAIGREARAGAVHIIRGSSAGLTKSGTQLWTQDSAGISFFAEAGDRFGASLAAGDFERDGNDDLAIGAPGDNVFDVDEGSVTLMRGSIVGMRPAGLIADLFGSNVPEAGDGYGATVAIADVGGYASADGYADLIVGIPGQNVFTSDAGRVDVISSDHSGPWMAVQSIDQSSFALSSRESSAHFGSVLNARTFGSRGLLTVGVPFDDVGSFTNAGSVHVYESGVTVDGFVGLGGLVRYDQDTPGFPGVVEANDFFGAGTSLLDVDGDGSPDVAIGSPGEAIGSLAYAGTIHVKRRVGEGSPSAAMFHQNSPSIAGGVEAGDRFGASLGS